MSDYFLLSLSNEPAVATTDPLVFEKEVLRTGRFVQTDKNGRKRVHVIDDAFLSNAERQFKEMQADGLSVPIPLEHTNDPEKRRGTALSLERRGQSLFAKIKFRDEEAAKLAKTANVSVFVPPAVRNAVHDKMYPSAIEHIALTAYPVIHDLKPFQALALSRDSAAEMYCHGIRPKSAT